MQAKATEKTNRSNNNNNGNGIISNIQPLTMAAELVGQTFHLTSPVWHATEDVVTWQRKYFDGFI